MKVILTGHCSLVANSLPDFPLPVKLAHEHEQNAERGSMSAVRAAELHCWGRAGMTSLMDFTVAAAEGPLDQHLINEAHD